MIELTQLAFTPKKAASRGRLFYYTRHQFACYACLAEGKATFNKQLVALENRPPPLEAWGSNAAYTFETCKRWALQG